MSASTVRTHENGAAGTHTTVLFDPADSSVVRVRDRRPGPGAEVAVAGPRDLWAGIERAHRLWLDLSRPRREWFTIRATPETQVVSFRTPGAQQYTWTP
ncbi:hypothetical protein [Streptomyces sp. YIM 98790]|uniref:hypothetical protein n=1 Tax=Streptomyces sp. YIM 98790 TaxID=2689077 RepID=UPI001A9F071A|nr:hypothetical protein [Streptomyces sp. YIM 98790]